MEPQSAADLEHEITLLQRVGAGDRTAFAELYDRFSQVLFAAAYRILNEREAAEDVLQDVFLQIWEKAPLYDSSRGKPLTWAITLTRNKAIDRLRANQRRHRLRDEMEKEAGTDERLDDHDSLQAVDLIEKGGLVRTALQNLPKEQRQAIELAFFSGLTQAEIAEQLGEPLGTIKARIRRGMMKLREVIAPKL